MFNIFSRLKTQDILDRDPGKFEPRPRRAWAVIFSVAVISTLFILVAHLYFYLYAHTDGSFKPNESDLVANEVRLNRNGLGEITAMFEAKNVKFQEFLTSPPKIADPSTDGQSSSGQYGAAAPKPAPKNATSSVPVFVQ